MATLRIRAAQIPHLSLPGFTRVIAGIAMMIEVFADAQDQARAAHRRYPFAEW